MKKLKGSYTIEASFLLPMILTIIVMIMYIAFILHDREILASAAYTSALRGSQVLEKNDTFSTVQKHSFDLIKDRLIITQNITTDIEIDGDKIIVRYDGDINIPKGVILVPELFKAGNNSIKVKAYGEAKRQDSIKFIRNCRIIENAL